MAMLPNLRIGAPAAVPGTPGPEEAPAQDLFAQLLGLLPNARFAAAPGAVTVTTSLGLDAETGEGEGVKESMVGPEKPEAAELMFLPTLEVQRSAPPLAAAATPQPATPAVAPSAIPGPEPTPAPTSTGPAPAPQPSVHRDPASAHVGYAREAPQMAPTAKMKAPAAARPAPAAAIPDAGEEVALSPAVAALTTVREAPRPGALGRPLAAVRAAVATPAAEPSGQGKAAPTKAVAFAVAPEIQQTKPRVPTQVQESGLAMAEAPSQTAPAEAAPALSPGPGAEAVERQLDVSADGEWLDQLARDIVRTGAAGGEGGALRFRLNPETLGQVRVELSQGAEGATVRIAAETEGARALLADAQPRLLAEARAQGVRIAETEVSLAGSGSSPEQQQRREDAQAEPRLRTALGGRGAAADTGEEPVRTNSDRYA